MNIISTNDRGLVGITETGKEVPLSVPKISFLKVDLNKAEVNKLHGKKIGEYYDHQLDIARERLLKETKNDIYLMLGKWVGTKEFLIHSYNLYTRRK